MRIRKPFKQDFPLYRQHDAMDCGPSCLRMIAKYYGRTLTAAYLRELCHIGRVGVSLLNISEAAEKIGMRTLGARLPFDKLAHGAPLPCMVHWKGSHFVVVYKITKKKVFVADPAMGHMDYSHQEFKEHWAGRGQDAGIVLLMEPQPAFFDLESSEVEDRLSLAYLWKYFRPYRRFLNQLLIGLVVASCLQLILPFLTQAIVDFGINNRDLDFVYLILLAQLMLFFSRTLVEFIRSWILLHLGTRINISILSDFLIKLVKLPMSFFDSKNIGDLMQRIDDHRRIESFLTSSTLNTAFSLINLVVFGIVLALYHTQVLVVFITGTVLSTLWIWVFMKRRRMLDHKRFERMAENQASLIQMIHGMRDIKLTNSEKQKRWDWENIKAGLFRVNVKFLSLTQIQESGNLFINELKNIVITFVAAKAVIEGDMTLGMMMSVTYIVGQLNAPVSQLLHLLHEIQDTRLSMERLGEVHLREEEDGQENKIDIFPEDHTIRIRNLDFHYNGPHSEKVLDNLNLDIQAKKVTAVVGMSGSGKSTLLKLLLKFYEPTSGEILVGDCNLSLFDTKLWRKRCGSVMQDGFIFSDTVMRNITMGTDTIDTSHFLESVRTSNIGKFLEKLPQGYNTLIGAEGHGLSHGQKQRILIARAIYMKPDYLFFDEATSALDANNERFIMEHLDEVFRGKTVLIIAHRLSTVKNADQIVVMEKGRAVEIGKHEELLRNKGPYYRLVKNQLELGG